jgi:hypothetical protein
MKKIAKHHQAERHVRLGLIWRWNRLYLLSIHEYRYWQENRSPLGWWIIRKPEILDKSIDLPIKTVTPGQIFYWIRPVRIYSVMSLIVSRLCQKIN